MSEYISPEEYKLLIQQAFMQCQELSVAMHSEQQQFEIAFCHLQNEMGILEYSEGRNELSEERCKRLVCDMYAAIRRAMRLLVRYSQLPHSFDLLLGPEVADAFSVRELDEKVDGIYAFPDGDMLRFRTPPLPHRNMPSIARGSKFPFGTPVPSTYAYTQELRREIDSKRDILSPIALFMPRKTIHFLFVYSPDNKLQTDNDNRDVSGIINAICRLVPGRDKPDCTRIMYDGKASDALPEGTYITLLPIEKGIPDENQTINFWLRNLPG